MTTLVLAYLQACVAQVRSSARTEREEGASTIEWIVLTALIVVLTIAVVGVISAKLMARANGIDLGGGTG